MLNIHTSDAIYTSISRLATSKKLLKDSTGYRLSGSIRNELDQKYKQSQRTVTVSSLLNDLPKKITGSDEREFLDEALACYRVKAFRAAIVMTWNLAYDHLTSWIFDDQNRINMFNSAITKRYPKSKVVIKKRDDFEAFKEDEVIEVCNSSGLFSKNIIKILKEKLTKRNIAAHPSNVKVTQVQADDVITDLVNNVVLKLA